MDIAIKNLQKQINLNLKQIRQTTEKILRHNQIDDAVLSVVFVDGKTIKALNKKYLKRSFATDVLAFDLRRPQDPSQNIVGEIIISTEAAIKNSAIYQTNVKHELILYVIHGILHLLGYDDHRLKDIKCMRQKEQELLAVLSTRR